MVTASSGDGSSSLTSWKRRANAGSLSMYFLYSDQVVAATVRISPRASAGLMMLAASPVPAWPPAPIRVCTSSMNRMIGLGEALTSSITDFSRFSNSPFTPAPACKSCKSRPSRSTSFRKSGTSPSTILRASPSTTADLPTPASPTQIGLFFRRRPRMSIIWRISRSRQNTGSILPARALPVTSSQKRPRAESSPRAGAVPSPAASCAPTGAVSSFDPAVMSKKARFSSSGRIGSSSSTKPPVA